MDNQNLVFLKLGGSLITDKFTPSTAKPELIAALAVELTKFLTDFPETRLVLGHGSGSFGHAPAKKYGTRQGVSTPEEWRGFLEVWYQASALNRIVMDQLHEAGMPALAFPASSSAVVSDGKVLRWELAPMQDALDRGLVPVVYGDVAFDQVRGGTILSTEDIFVHLARQLKPNRILMAGVEDGVWADYPANTELISVITPETWQQKMGAVGGSAATDVTGGMSGKVSEMMSLVESIHGLEVLIFSAGEPGKLWRVMTGENIGTLLKMGN